MFEGMGKDRPLGGAYHMFTHLLEHVSHELPGVGILALQSECPGHPTGLLERKPLSAVLHMLLIPFSCRRKLGVSTLPPRPVKPACLPQSLVKRKLQDYNK